MRAALIAGLLALSPLAARAAEPNATCAANYDQDWRKALEAFTASRTEEATAQTEAMISACGESPYSYWPRVMRAGIAIQEKDAAAAIKILAPVPRAGKQPLGKSASWIAMQADLALKDDAAFGAERDQLMAEVDRALTDPNGAVKGKKLETFAVGDVQVSAYEIDMTQSTLRRRYYFAVLRPGPFYPESVMITSDLMAEAFAAKSDSIHYFADAYYCAGQALIGSLEAQHKSKDAKPRYEHARALVETFVRGQTAPVSVSEGVGPRCAFPDYQAPGLTQ